MKEKPLSPKRIFLSKKLLATVLAALLLTALLLPFKGVQAAALSPFPPVFAGSGLVFRQHEQIKINKEILNIQVNNSATVNIKTVYTLENTSEEALNIETMFLSPALYGKDKEISVQKNGEDLNFNQIFYNTDYHYKVLDLDDWENVLDSIRNPRRPLGDGTGFCEYTISPKNKEEFSVVFSPKSYYFFDAFYNTELNGKVKLTTYKWQDKEKYDDMILVCSENTDLETDGSLVKKEINDIYDYLLQKAITQAQEDLLLAEGMLSVFLNNINNNSKGYKFSGLYHWSPYISAITQFIDFAPNEVLEFTVSCVCQTGASDMGRMVEFIYYFSPEKYWKNNLDIEINLTLSPKYKKLVGAYLDSQKLDLTKIDEKNYTFTLNSSYASQFGFKVSDGSVFIEKWFYLVIIIVFIVFIVGLISIPIIIRIFIIKKKKYNQNNPDPFSRF